jgi:predicted DNA-binding protein
LQSILIAIKGGVKMALGKKYVVQKSFRIDAKLERDLEYLSIKLGRPQNDLVNLSLEMLIHDNEAWFTENIIVDDFFPVFEGTCEDYEVEIGNVYVRIYTDMNSKDLDTVCVGNVKSDNGEIIDKWKNVYKDDPDEFDKIKDFLRQIALIHLCDKPEIIKPYLKDRLNYR